MSSFVAFMTSYLCDTPLAFFLRSFCACFDVLFCLRDTHCKFYARLSPLLEFLWSTCLFNAVFPSTHARATMRWTGRSPLKYGLLTRTYLYPCRLSKMNGFNLLPQYFIVPLSPTSSVTRCFVRGALYVYLLNYSFVVFICCFPLFELTLC